MSKPALQAVTGLPAVLLALGAAACSPPETTTAKTRSELTAAAATTRPMNDFIGIAMGANVADLKTLTDLGIHRVRTDFRWKTIEPDHEGNWQFSGTDRFVGAAAAAQIKVLGILDYGNPWATALCTPTGEDDFAFPPDNYAKFVDFAKKVVQHYDESWPGTVFGYEVWNEENAGYRFWLTAQWTSVDGAVLCGEVSSEDTAGFGRLVSQTIDGVNSLSLQHGRPLIAPGGTIYLPEPAPPLSPPGMLSSRSGNDYVKDVFSNTPGLAGKLTAGAFHAYEAYPPVSAPESEALSNGIFEVQLGDKVSLTRANYSQAGFDAGKPLWITEIGWPTKFVDSVNQGDQAAYLLRSVLLSALGGVDQIYLFTLKDDPNNATWEGGFGLFDDNLQPKQSYVALKAFLQLLGNYHVASRIAANDPNNSAYVLSLSDGSHTCYALWDSAGDQGFSWVVPSDYDVFNIDGSKRQTGGGVTLTGSPAFACPGPTPPPPPPPPADVVVGCTAAGDQIDQLGGVIDYCDDPAGAGEFQCDQFVNRYMSSLNLPPVDDWVHNLACEICDLVNTDSHLQTLYSVWGPGYRATAGHEPGPNDLLVWWEPAGGCNENNKGSPGHAAVVTSSDSSFVHYIQQNWIVNESVNGSPYASVARSAAAWNASTSFFGHAGGPGGAGFAPKCWIHPECAPGKSCNPGLGANPCREVTHANNGQYCGTSTQSGFLPGSADPSTVYECFDGQVANEQHCQAGCFVAPAGQPDACNTSDPCAAVPGTANGTYCTSSTQSGFNQRHTAVQSSVYNCVNSKTADYSYCFWNGCTVAPSGQPDKCTTDPCAGVSSTNNGAFCGTSNQLGFNPGVADSGTLYTCHNGRTVDTAFCDQGCIVGATGQPDTCRNDPCANVASASNGMYCGASTQAGFNPAAADPVTLFYCKDRHTLWAQPCANGCFVAPSGLPDGCK